MRVWVCDDGAVVFATYVAVRVVLFVWVFGVLLGDAGEEKDRGEK